MNKNEKISSETLFAGQKITIKSGGFAAQADSAVMVQVGDTTVLVTVVSKPSADDVDFLPLRIDYEERYYAGGVLSGSRYTRREGKPTDQAIVDGRLIDHAIRPLFPKDFKDDTQLILTVLSYDGVNSAILAGFLGVSAALSASGLPFKGPIVPLRISKVNGENTYDLGIEKEDSSMDLVVSYLDEGKKVQAIESHADMIPETEVVAAIKAGAEHAKTLFALLNDFQSKTGAVEKAYEKSWLSKELINEFKPHFLPIFETLSAKGLSYNDSEWISEQNKKVAELAPNYEGRLTDVQINIVAAEVQKEWVRDIVLVKNSRIDGRGDLEIRPLSAQVGLLPRVHGTGMFSRGLTQALTIVTLGAVSEKLVIQNMTGESKKRYIHHYNFPPYSTGEIGKVGGSNRREIGHGMLAEKALVPVLPEEEKFPYTIRLVSEILSSNGSTSMASTCGSSLALMDAGVPIKEHVAGIGVGLFVDKSKENLKLEDYKLLVDIMGIEDFSGYMDFKLTGTRSGMTAIQLELKLQGLPLELLDSMFEVSRQARNQVLDVMNEAISEPRSQLGQYVPKIDMVRIEKDQIGTVIGSGGSTIRAIMEATGAQVDVEENPEDATVSIVAPNQESLEKAKNMIIAMTREYNVGDEVEGEVVRIEPYGVFVQFAPKQEGLLHVSEYSYDFVDDISQIVSMGDLIKAKIISTENGKIALSKKALMEKPEGYVEPVRNQPRDRGGFRGNRNNGNGRRDFGRRQPYNR